MIAPGISGGMILNIFRCCGLPRLVAVGLFLGLSAPCLSAAEPPLDIYGRLPALEQVVLSDSGERLAYVTVVGNERKLVAQSLKPEPQTLGLWPLGDLKLRSVDWAGEDYVIVTVSQTVNLGFDYGFENELARVIVINLADGSIKPLLGRASTFGASLGSYGYRQIDGQWYAFLRALPISGGRLQDAVLARVNLKDQEVDYITRGNSAYSEAEWLIGADGEVLATAKYQDKKGGWRLFAGTASGRELARGVDSMGSNSLIGLGRTPGTALYTYADGHDHVRYMEVPLQPAADGTAAPVNLAAQAEAPVLLIHGRDDTVVPIDQSRIMRKALQRADKPVEYLEMDGEDHWLSREQTRQAMLKAAVEFVQRHNPATATATATTAAP